MKATLSITRNNSRVVVLGKRSTKGWNVLRTDGARADHQGHRKRKEDALQLALDCCEPGISAEFTVKPSS